MSQRPVVSRYHCKHGLEQLYMLTCRCIGKDIATDLRLRANRQHGMAVSRPLVLATGPGNQPAVRVWTTKMVRFGPRPIQIPDPPALGGPNTYPCPSTIRFSWVDLDSSVPISSSAFRVFLFVVPFRYHTINRRILTLVHHCLFLMCWPHL